MSEKLREFINKVDGYAGFGDIIVHIDRDLAEAARDFIRQTLEARARGGANSRKNYKPSMEPKAVANRKAVSAFRKRQREQASTE